MAGDLVFLGVMIAGIVAGNVWAISAFQRRLQLSLPSLKKQPFNLPGSRRPHAYVEGRPVPGPSPCFAPLTERPCAAWRLSLVKRHEWLGTIIGRHERYSDANFFIEREGKRTPVVLHADTANAFPGSMVPHHFPLWLLPKVDPKQSFTMFVYDGVPSPPLDFKASKDHSLALQRAAETEINRFDLSGDALAGELLLVETIIDFERDWACEGPTFELDGRMSIHSNTNSHQSFWNPDPVKLAAVTKLPSHTLKFTALHLTPLLLFDLLLLPALTYAFFAILLGVL